jgi:hypothetical protein
MGKWHQRLHDKIIYKDIKAHGGLVLAQALDSAIYDGMPRSAIGTKVVDMILPPEEMPHRLLDYFTNSYSFFRDRGSYDGCSLKKRALFCNTTI